MSSSSSVLVRLGPSRRLTLLLGCALVGALAGCEDCSKGGGGDTAADGAARAVDGAPLSSAAPGTDGGNDSGVLNATPLPAASVAAMLNPQGLPAYTGPTGSVEGTITVTGEMAAESKADFSRCPDAERTWGRIFREGVPTGGIRPLADAIVVVTGYKGFYLPEKEEAKEITIDDCAYTTRTATMTFGQRLDVKNVSKDFWTPVLEPGSNMVLMMATPKGDPAKIYVKKPGHYLLLDRDRKYAVVDVYAFLHPLHASSDLTGHYRIDGLPVGKVKVSSTHPRIESNAEADLTVIAGVVHKVDLVLKNASRDAGAAKDGGAAIAPPLLH